MTKKSKKKEEVVEEAKQDDTPEQFTQEELESFLGLTPKEGDETTVAESDNPPKEGKEDGSEGEPQESLGQSEGDGGDEEGEEEEEEDEQEEEEEIDLKPFEERLQKIEEQLQPEPEQEQTSLRGQLKAFEQQVAQEEAALQNFNLLEGLPAYQHNGKSIYEMNAQELNDYIVELQDNSQALLAGQVQTAYFNAVERAKSYQGRLQALEQQQTQLRQSQDYVEWVEVGEEIRGQLPELTQQDLAQVEQFIQQGLQTNPTFQLAVATKVGKIQKAVEALEKLGILKRLKEQAAPAKIKAPSAPDARTVSKKVKRNDAGKATYQIEEARTMSQAEFNKLPNDVIDEFLKASFG